MRRSWLLPSFLRLMAAALVLIAAGLVVLSEVGHYGSLGRTVVLAVVIVVALALAFIPGRPVRPAFRTTATVLRVNERPTTGIIGSCLMTLYITEVGHTTVHDLSVPVTRWPRVGSVLPVDVTPRDRPRVKVRWHDVAPRPVREAPEPASDPTPVGDVPIRPVPSEPIEFDDLRFEPFSSELIEFDDDELASLTAGVGFDPVDLLLHNEPSDLVRRYLFPTEKFRGEWRRHWLRLGKELALFLALALLLQSGYRIQYGPVDLNLADIPRPELTSQLVWIVLALWVSGAWYVNRLVLTNKRLMVVKGVLWRRVQTLPLAKAADSHFTSSVLGRIVGSGAIRFSHIPYFRPLWRVGDLPNPTDLYLQIVEEVFEPEASEARRRPARIDDGL